YRVIGAVDRGSDFFVGLFQGTVFIVDQFVVAVVRFKFIVIQAIDFVGRNFALIVQRMHTQVVAGTLCGCFTTDRSGVVFDVVLRAGASVFGQVSVSCSGRSSSSAFRGGGC